MHFLIQLSFHSSIHPSIFLTNICLPSLPSIHCALPVAVLYSAAFCSFQLSVCLSVRLIRLKFKVKD